LSRFPSDWLEEKWYALLVAAPSQLREALTAVAEQLLESGQALPSRLSAQLAAQAGQAAAALPSLFLTLITGLLAIFFCSADLPRIRAYLRELIPEEKRGAVASVLSCLRRALLDWCRVQGRLMAVVFGILTVGLLLLRVPYAFLAAGVGALIDALPFFGSGVLLVPWAILSFLQKETGRAIGLLVLYGVICLTRSLLEPRFYGTQTGVSPLVTLLALYGGFHLFGVWGMLLAPVAVSITASLVQAKKNADQPQNT
jgi:sporulation integral membrane protein YtvI